MKYCTFEYLSHGKHIGLKGYNGFNFLLTYVRDLKTKKYGTQKMVESSCVLKSVLDKEADNLFYEYMVGAWLNNKINENFPFFVCTHGFFTYKTDKDHRSMYRLYETQQTINENNKHIMTDVLRLQHYKGKKWSEDEFISLLRMSYTHPLRMCVLIEAVPNAKTFYNTLKSNDSTFYQNDLIPVLFQVYGAIYKICNEFTHHDLHVSNILLTELTEI